MQAATHAGLAWSEFMRWSELDRGLAIAEERVQRLTGPSGQWLPDATSDEYNPTNYDFPTKRFITEGPHMDWAEKARQDQEDQWKKEAGENANLNGLFWTVKPLDPTS